MSRRTTHPAFTLIELLLVLVVIATALAIAAPQMSGWGRGSRMRDAGDHLLATTRWARTQAIADGQVYRLNVDAANNRYWVTTQQGMEFVPVENSFGRETFGEDGATLQLVDDQQHPIEYVTFYPNGRISPPSRLSMADDRNHVDMVCKTPAEGFRLRKPGEVLQEP